jgi:hypothetical protein
MGVWGVDLGEDWSGPSASGPLPLKTIRHSLILGRRLSALYSKDSSRGFYCQEV